MEGCFTFQWGVCFSDWGASFLSGVCAHGVIGFDAGGGELKKMIGWGEASPHVPSPHTMENPVYGKFYADNG